MDSGYVDRLFFPDNPMRLLPYFATAEGRKTVASARERAAVLEGKTKLKRGEQEELARMQSVVRWDVRQKIGGVLAGALVLVGGVWVAARGLGGGEPPPDNDPKGRLVVPAEEEASSDIEGADEA